MKNVALMGSLHVNLTVDMKDHTNAISQAYVISKSHINVDMFVGQTQRFNAISYVATMEPIRVAIQLSICARITEPIHAEINVDRMENWHVNWTVDTKDHINVAIIKHVALKGSINVVTSVDLIGRSNVPTRADTKAIIHVDILLSISVGTKNISVVINVDPMGL